MQPDARTVTPRPLASREARLIKLIHVGKRELGLDEAVYRAALVRVSGHDSASKCTLAQLMKIFHEMQRLGFKPRAATERRDFRPAGTTGKKRMIQAIWADIATMLHPHPGDPDLQRALRAFVRRQTVDRLHPDGVDAVEFLDDRQCDRVIEGLKGWRDGLMAKAAP